MLFLIEKKIPASTHGFIAALKATLCASALVLVGLGSAHAIPVAYVFDEFGTGFVSFNNGPRTPLISAFRADPGPGGRPSVLGYVVGLTPVPGDVLITENPVTLSDVLRFVGSPGVVFFYSDNSDGADAPADVGFPTAFNSTFVVVPEVGAEGSNGAFYAPTSGQPGFVPGFEITYTIVSDGRIPEPGSLALLGIGLAAFGINRRRKTA
jgi:hypothetical protein